MARGCSSMVEQKPSKLTTRVRFPSPAPGPLLSPRATAEHVCMDKELERPCSSVVEHSLGKGEVARSIRAMGTTVQSMSAVRSSRGPGSGEALRRARNTDSH